MCVFQAQHRDSFVQERYGQYDLSDPFLALHRDSETMESWTDGEQAPGGGETAGRAGRGSAVGPNPLAVLKLVMAHCKRMQERMMGQLAAAESRHRRVREIRTHAHTPTHARTTPYPHAQTHHRHTHKQRRVRWIQTE